MSGINKVILIGNVGKIEARQTKAGETVVSLSIATSIKYKDKRSGEDVEQTEWHNCTLFKKVAEIADKYVTKGSKIYVEGSLKTDKWQSKSGEDHYSTKIIVNQLQLLSSKQDGDKASPTEAKADDYRKASGSSANEYSDLDDQIPF